MYARLFLKGAPANEFDPAQYECLLSCARRYRSASKGHQNEKNTRETLQ